MGTVYSLGTGKMVPIKVDDKNDLPIGTVLQLEGYNNPRYVITANLGVNPMFSGYGTMYETLNLETMSMHRHEALCLEWLRNKKNGGIQMYITDETMLAFDGLSLEEVVTHVKKQDVIRKAEEAARPIPENISLTDTAKLIRAELKKHYPAVKFSVRSKSYSGGCSINVSWTDGPETESVDQIIQQFSGADFDGMQDLKTHHDSEWNGKLVSFGVDYIFSNRHISNWEEKQKLAEELIRLTCKVDADSHGYERFGNEWISDFASRILRAQDCTKNESLSDAIEKCFNHRY